MPVGSYQVPYVGYVISGLGSYSNKVGYLDKGIWYEPTDRAGFFCLNMHPRHEAMEDSIVVLSSNG